MTTDETAPVRSLPYVRIVSKGISPSSVKVTTPEGVEITGIASVHLVLEPSKPITAAVTLYTEQLDIEAHALLSLPNVEAAAAFHGYKLTPLTEG